MPARSGMAKSNCGGLRQLLNLVSRHAKTDGTASANGGGSGPGKLVVGFGSFESDSTRQWVGTAEELFEDRLNVPRQDISERSARCSALEKKPQGEALSEEEIQPFLPAPEDRECGALLQRHRTTLDDFEPLRIIGRGGFGEVWLVKVRSTGKIMAMKKLKKVEMLKKGQAKYVKAERDVLAEVQSPYIVKLYYSFQDKHFLYLVMEYLPGGDTMTLLMRKDILTEEETRFYIAETILGLETIHKAGYIHRDIKPDNLLLTRDGHLKLSDFGLCKLVDVHRTLRAGTWADNCGSSNGSSGTCGDAGQGANSSSGSAYDEDSTNSAARLDAGTLRCRRTALSSFAMSHRQWRSQGPGSRRHLAFSTVGTPNYIAPEVLQRKGYGMECDWWSVGAIMFEMLVGFPPFYSDEPMTACRKIVNWRTYLSFPMEARLSTAARDLICRLMCDVDERIGTRGGVEEIKSHPFFYGLDWDNLHKKPAPFVPKVDHELDTQNFEHFEEDDVQRFTEAGPHFHGYTYTNWKVWRS